MILAKGNFTTALGCLYAGAAVAAWYPITPATSVAESFARLCDRYRQDPHHGYLVLQAEDELAACGMVVGASWAGARAFTATSGPGVSLMNEILGLAYYAEIPAVIFDVQRAGPSTGMPTRTQQSDLLTCAYASHGDTRHILLFPSDPAECFDFAVAAFDLAEHFQTPVIVLSDLDIGMNDWSVPRLNWDDSYRPDRGRVLGAAELEEVSEFFRYVDPDVDSVCARTRPGVSAKGAYFARGSGHDRFGRYSEAGDAYMEVVDRLARKHDAARSFVPAAVVESGAGPGIITLGSCDRAVREARELLASAGLATDYMRVRGFPFGPEVATFVAEHETCFVVEQNRDAQLRSLLILAAGATPGGLRPVLAYDGLPLDAGRVADAVVAEMEGLGAVH